MGDRLAASARVAGAAIGRAARQALDFLMPPRCLACGRVVEAAGALCPACWPRIEFVAPPLCAACGYPFEFDPGQGALCAACGRDPPPYERARAAIRYDGASRGLVLAFKHGDRTDAALAYGRWLARAGAELLAEAEMIVPVPLHWTRLFARRYNQAALLAQAVSRLSGVPMACDALLRVRRTPSQGAMGPDSRRRNVRRAFVLSDKARAAIEGRRVVLVDDVLTTGATAAECARALKEGGAKAVDVLTLARVVRPQA